MKTIDAKEHLLDARPRHHIRCLQQIAVGIFVQEPAGTGIPPVPFTSTPAMADPTGLQRRTLARTIGLYTSTIAAPSI